MIDTATIRARFPALERRVGGQQVIHADNPGGTQVPRSVAEAMTDYLLHRNANVHGAFLTSRLTDETILGARSAMADFLNAPSPQEIVFGPNMTTLTFSVSRAIGRTLNEGDEIIATNLDHDANFTPWTTLRERGVVIHQVGIHREDVTLDMADLEQKLSRRTRVVAVGHASNAVGTINPVRNIAKMVRATAPDAIIFVDAVQSVPHIPVDVQALGCDLLACSAYKFFGPHVGVLWGRYDLLDRLPAYKVRPAGDEPPDKFETGTQNHEGIAGVEAAVEYIASLAPENDDRRARLRDAMVNIQQYEQELSRQMLRGLRAIQGMRLYGIDDLDRVDERVPTMAVTIEGRTPQELSEKLGEQGIFAWAGHYYALNLIETLGLAPHGALRLGLAHYNTPAEVDRLLETLDDLR